MTYQSLYEAIGVPAVDEASSWEDVAQILESAVLVDGLPTVPPTPARLRRMLGAVADPARPYGQVPPLFGELTPAAAAYYCVLAGCAPECLPVVLTALIACLKQEFNLLGMQTTTGAPTVAAVLHGPVKSLVNANSGANCLGPGNRANATIGRAIRLALTNLGGATPGLVDMATIGQPGKYGMCFAESDSQLFSPFHVRQGFEASDSAVTVIGVSGTMEVVPAGGDPRPEAIVSSVAHAVAGAGRPATGPSGQHPESFLVLPHELAETLTNEGWTLEDFQAALEHEGDQSPHGKLHTIVAGGAGIKMIYLPTWAGGTVPITAGLVESM